MSPIVEVAHALDSPDSIFSADPNIQRFVTNQAHEPLSLTDNSK